MISICIPVYNYNISTLVEGLKWAVAFSQVPAEIIIYEDGSETLNPEFENDDTSRIIVRQYTGESNKGRSFARNFLAHKASYPNLLFLDCDGFIPDQHYIINYVPFLALKNTVISGGRSYQSLEPKNQAYLLHWLYGTRIESKLAGERNFQAYLLFHSNNFLVSKELLLEHPFDEELSSYGYEDTVWAKTIHEKGISILHIDNVVIHLGLERNDVFIEKTNQALMNLVFLRRNNKSPGIKLESFYHEHFLAKIGLVKLGVKLFKFTMPWLVANLKSAHPKLWIYSMYKIFTYSIYWDEVHVLPKKLP